MKNIVLLGSTGSIGTQTLDVVRSYKEDLHVVALAAGNSVEKMEQQIREFSPSYAVMWSEEAAKDLKQRVSDLQVQVLTGMDGLLAISVLPEADVVLTAIVGMIGIRPTIAAIEAGKDIALANKETLVTAGHIIMPLAKKHGVKILPVDSEHSAIFQSLNGEPKDKIRQILLTASGGPFRGFTKEQLTNVKAADALKHPNWTMGRNNGQQRTGGYGSRLVIPCTAGKNNCSSTTTKHHTFYGRVCRWRGDRTAWRTGHETADPVCTFLS